MISKFMQFTYLHIHDTKSKYNEALFIFRENLVFLDLVDFQ